MRAYQKRTCGEAFYFLPAVTSADYMGPVDALSFFDLLLDHGIDRWIGFPIRCIHYYSFYIFQISLFFFIFCYDKNSDLRTFC